MSTAPSFVLASGSPRRRMLLLAAGFEFEVVVSDIDESAQREELPGDLVMRLATEKALSVAKRLETEGVAPEPVILGADTIVVLDGEILGKPTDEPDAVRILMALSGRPHDVLTGFAITSGDAVLAQGQVRSGVSFRTITKDEAAEYVATGEPMDKAGAYGLQGKGSAFVSSIDGSRANVIGLPLGVVVPQLEAAGVPRQGRLV